MAMQPLHEDHRVGVALGLQDLEASIGRIELRVTAREEALWGAGVQSRDEEDGDDCSLGLESQHTPELWPDNHTAL
jgi:hypothetical protein